MSKWNKLLILLGIIVLGAVSFGLLLRPNEPKSQGRYLSEWLQTYRNAASPHSSDPAVAAASERAVRAIGTNALPYCMKWIRCEPRTSLYLKLPRWMLVNPMVYRWYNGPRLRAASAVGGIRILGTNAASAIPELARIMRDGTKPWASGNAIHALRFVGEPAIPVLKAALADTNQVNRWHIVEAFEVLVRLGHTNACLPSLIEALDDTNTDVRFGATNAIQNIAPHLLTNAPAP